MQHECDNLDAYLDDELRGDAAACFAAHLAHCDACREAVEEQRWIDGLLRSPARLELESPPVALLDSCRSTVAQRQRKIPSFAWALAAAAAIVVAAGWTALRNHDGKQAEGPNVASVALNHADINRSTFEPDAQVTARLTDALFVAGPNVIAMPVESRHPDVTIVRVYSTFQPVIANQAAVEPTNGDDFAWPSPSSRGS